MPEKSLVSEKAFLTCSPCNQTLCTAFAARNLHYMIVVLDELAHEFVLFQSTPPKNLKKRKKKNIFFIVGLVVVVVAALNIETIPSDASCSFNEKMILNAFSAPITVLGGLHMPHMCLNCAFSIN